MSQAQLNIPIDLSEMDMPSIDLPDIDSIMLKRQEQIKELNKQETFVIKSLSGDKLNSVYNDSIDYSTAEGKAEMNVLGKVISQNNWLIMPQSMAELYDNGVFSLEELQDSIIKTHEKLNISKPSFLVEQQVSDQSFISNLSDIQAPPEIESLNRAKENINLKKPSEILTNFDTSVQNKMNELSYHRSKVKSQKGKVSIKMLAVSGGIYLLGSMFTPLGALTIPAAGLIGGYAILKGIFGKDPELKNYDQQIEILKEATATMVLKSTGEDNKESIGNFIKNNKGLVGTLFDDKIEAEFARICTKRNIKINRDVFKNAHKYENDHVSQYNKEIKSKRI